MAHWTSESNTHLGPDSDRAGLTLTRQAPAIESVPLDGPPSEVWRALASTEWIQRASIDAVRDVAAGRTAAELHDLLDEHDIHATERAIESLIRRIAEGDSGAVWEFLTAARMPGYGRASLDDARALTRLFALSNVTPTVAFRLTDVFFERRADQRRKTCELIAALVRGCDVRLVGTGYQQKKLAREHHADLPGSVREQCKTPRGRGPVDELVEAAREALDPDGKVVDILRAIADAPSETRRYHALYSDLSARKGTIRAAVKTLRDLELVETFGPRTDRAVELRIAGRAYLDTIDREIGRQHRLSDCVGESGNPPPHTRVPQTASRTAPPDGVEAEAEATAEADAADNRRERDRHHTVDYLGRRETAAAVGRAVDGGITVTNCSVDGHRTGGSTGWSNDPADDRLVVSAGYVTVPQWWVSVARALSDTKTWHRVLTEDRLTESDLAGLIDEHKGFLRDSRCLGWLPERTADAAEFAEALQEARDELLDLSRMLPTWEHEMDRSDFCSLVVREGKGLAGVMVHLLDLAGVDLVVEVRATRAQRGPEEREKMLDSLAGFVTLASKYGHHVAHRQLYEDRADKRRQALTPTVDAADPFGELIPSISIVGNFGNQTEEFADALRRKIAGLDPHEDAPEFAIPVSIEATHGRQAVAAVAREVCGSKNLDVTREDVSLLHAFARTPYDVADALSQLGREETPRDLRVSEVRYALTHLDPDRLLRDATPTVRKAISALLRADRPLSQAGLAEAADVSTRSLRDHLRRLVAIGLVEEPPEGYRLCLSFHGDEERHADVLPWYVGDGRTLARDVLYEAAFALIDDLDPYGDPDDPVFGVWIDPPPDGVPDVSRLVDPWPWVEWALPLLRALCGQEAAAAGREAETVTFGAEIEQTSLAASPAVSGLAAD